MNRLKISTRLAMLIGVMSALLIVVGSIGLLGISKANHAIQTIYDNRLVATGQLAEINERQLRTRLAIAVALVTPQPEIFASSLAEVENNLAAIAQP